MTLLSLRQILSRRILTLQKHWGIWCADGKGDLYKADNWNYNPVVCFSVERSEILLGIAMVVSVLTIPVHGAEGWNPGVRWDECLMWTGWILECV